MIAINELVAAAQNGDENAFITLFQQYEVDLYRIAYVYTKNQDDALDVVQETAYRSFKNIHTLKEPKYFKTWLIKIAMSCATDILRKKKKVVFLDTELKPPVQSTEVDLPLTISLKSLINNLKEDEKKIVMLKYYYDYTFKEISNIMQVPIGTIKSILYRSLNKLKHQFKEGETS
ncbi:sigma-70 family RNA polymerase sigma factor [Falsibacillus albus]|uniref:sigma-70 family RNA polymerase sigma factor n=1 Tax=Falsibacillus albus TaxID=2478915 RepID=UPI001F372D4C|nr:sigma-70 family RNA polymerase sigma factor [Falsibacillus albus]